MIRVHLVLAGLDIDHHELAVMLRLEQEAQLLGIDFRAAFRDLTDPFPVGVHDEGIIAFHG